MWEYYTIQKKEKIFSESFDTIVLLQDDPRRTIRVLDFDDFAARTIL